MAKYELGLTEAVDLCFFKGLLPEPRASARADAQALASHRLVKLQSWADSNREGEAPAEPM